MKNWAQKLLVILIGLPLFLYAIFESYNFWFYTQNQRAAVLYVLPNDYLGWVVITYDASCAPALQEAGLRKYVISEQGTLCVSDEPGSGFAKDQVLHANRPDQNLLQHPSSLSNYVWYDKRFESAGKSYFVFYVGSEVPKKDQPKLFETLHEMLKG